MDFLFPLVLLAIGVYVLVSAIRGKGRLFQAEFIKEKFQVLFPKVLRSLYLALGILMVLQVISSSATGLLYTSETSYTLTEEITNGLGETYPVGGTYTYEEMVTEVYATAVPGESTEQTEAPASTSGSLCAPAEQPYTAHVEYTIKDDRFQAFTPELLSGFATGLMLVSLAILIAIIVVINIMTDKTKRREAQAEAMRASSGMPSAAFEFNKEDKEEE